MTDIIPARYQPKLPLEQLIISDGPGAEALEVDVLFVGGGPAGLSGALELTRLVRAEREQGGTIGDVSVGVLEKAGSLGEHSLSGAVVNPRVFRDLFPRRPSRICRSASRSDAKRCTSSPRAGRSELPTPPTMHNEGFYSASLCEIVRWLGSTRRGRGGQRFRGLSGGGAADRGHAGGRSADHSIRARSGRPPERHLRRAHRRWSPR